MRKILMTLLAVGLLAAACGDDDAITTEEPNDGHSVHDEWTLVSGPVPAAAIGATTLRIADDDTAGGSTACNSYGTDGPAIDGDRWIATMFFVTEMGCEPDRMEAETLYLDVLATMTELAVSETTLELSTAEGSSVLRFERVIPPPDSDLTGTTWVLESLLHGDAVSSTMGGAEDAVLVLDPDGSVSGTDGGCGEISGSYEIDGDRILWSVAIDLGTGCEERFTGQSSHIEQVLASETTFDIEGPRLTLTAPDGTGLDYRDRV